MPTEAFITPELVRWARERDDLTTETAAKRVNVKPEKFDAWEKGNARPTLRQAQTLANKLKIPLGYLYLSAPPVETLALPDLRTVADEPPRRPSPDLFDLLNDVLRKQQWYREHQEAAMAGPIPFVGRYSLNDSRDTIAADITATLGVNDEMRRRATSWEHFLRLFIGQAEAAGILVLRSGVVENNPHRKLSVREFRGFAISDDLAPLVFINSQDAKVAQTFTLAHEIAHLWVGESGVSNPDYRQLSVQQSNSTERLCNRVAAEILVPREDFLLKWDGNGTVEANFQTLSARYRVSQLVVLRQSFDLELLTREVYWNHFDRLIGQKGSAKGEGGSFYATLFARNSNTLTTALITAVAEGTVLHRDAARLLNVKVKTLDGIAERLLGSRLSG
ncbi:MAG: ImmA/IrrE family metallo-endopeptidase [Chloroflexi bacterium]|nr:ImmA/IrrE family metallo-endopeptidase [Chloroflexota bacterium]